MRKGREGNRLLVRALQRASERLEQKLKDDAPEKLVPEIYERPGKAAPTEHRGPVSGVVFGVGPRLGNQQEKSLHFFPILTEVTMPAIRQSPSQKVPRVVWLSGPISHCPEVGLEWCSMDILRRSLCDMVVVSWPPGRLCAGIAAPTRTNSAGKMEP